MWKEILPRLSLSPWGAPMYADHHGIPAESDADVSWRAPLVGEAQHHLNVNSPAIGAERCGPLRLLHFKAVKSRISRSKSGLTSPRHHWQVVMVEVNKVDGLSRWLESKYIRIGHVLERWKVIIF